MLMTFMVLMVPLAGIGAALWLRHARQTDAHWVGRWLGTLVPVGLLLAIVPVLAEVPDLLFMALLGLATFGAAAFTGGGLYLLISSLAASESVQAAGSTMLEAFHEAVNSPSTANDSEYWDDDARFISESHRRDVEIYGEHAYHSYGEYSDN